MDHLLKHHKYSLLTLSIVLIILTGCVIGGTIFSWVLVFLKGAHYLEATATWTIGDVSVLATFIYFLYNSGTNLKTLFSLSPIDNSFHLSILNKNKTSIGYRLVGVYCSNREPSNKTIKEIIRNDENDYDGGFVTEFVLTQQHENWKVIPPFDVSETIVISPQIIDTAVPKKKRYLTVIILNDNDESYIFTYRYHQ